MSSGMQSCILSVAVAVSLNCSGLQSQMILNHTISSKHKQEYMNKNIDKDQSLTQLVNHILQSQTQDSALSLLLDLHD